MTATPKIYRITGAAPGTPAEVTTVNFTEWDSNASLSLYPVKRSAAGLSYIVVLAIGFSSDPTSATSFTFWPTLTGGTIDTDTFIDIGTTLATTYIQPTGTVASVGTSISALYSLATESLFTYSAVNPKIISGSDVLKTSGTGLFTKYLILQLRTNVTSDLGAFPDVVALRTTPGTPITVALHCEALES